MIVVGLLLLVGAAVAVGVALSARRRWYAMLGTDTVTVAELRAHLETARGLGAAGGLAGGLAGGFATTSEVVGTARPGPHGELTSELSGTPCVWYRYVVRRRYWHDSRDAKGNRVRSQRSETVAELASSAPFEIADATGAVRVRPDGADVDNAERVLDRFVPDESGSSLSFLNIPLGGGSGTIGYEQEEWVLRPGIRLYTLGEATDRSGELEIVRPGSGPFIISTRSEAELSARLRRTQRIAMAAGAVAAAGGVVALVVGALR